MSKTKEILLDKSTVEGLFAALGAYLKREMGIDEIEIKYGVSGDDLDGFAKEYKRALSKFSQRLGPEEARESAFVAAMAVQAIKIKYVDRSKRAAYN